MALPRLSHAIESGALAPFDALIVVAPPEGARAADYPAKSLRVVTRSASAKAAWEAAKVEVLESIPAGETPVLLHLPRAKAEARAMMAEAAKASPLLIVDGDKADGVESALKSVKPRVVLAGTLSKSHGKIFWFETSGADFSEWQAAPQTVEGGFVTRPGVFSADGPDKGSMALLEALPALKGHVVDLGAGWGYLARAALAENDTITALDLVEDDRVALMCARENVTDPRAAFHWADATTFKPRLPVDNVIMNPPFHKGRSGVPELGRAFIRSAAGKLAPSGALFMVANRHLPYEEALGQSFAHVEELPGTGGFKIYRAAKPSRRNR